MLIFLNCLWFYLCIRRHTLTLIFWILVFLVLLKFFYRNLKMSFQKRFLMACRQLGGLNIKSTLFQKHLYQIGRDIGAILKSLKNSNSKWRSWCRKDTFVRAFLVACRQKRFLVACRQLVGLNIKSTLFQKHLYQIGRHIGAILKSLKNSNSKWRSWCRKDTFVRAWVFVQFSCFLSQRKTRLGECVSIAKLSITSL